MIPSLARKYSAGAKVSRGGVHSKVEHIYIIMNGGKNGAE